MFSEYYCKKIISMVCFIIFSVSHSVHAEKFNIIAEYIPNSYEHQGGRFINKTSCSMEYPFELYYCNPKKPLESSTIIQFPVDVFRSIRSKQGKSYYLSYYSLSGPKRFTITNDKDGSSYELIMVPTHIGVETEKMQLPGGHYRPMSRINGDCVFSTENAWGTPAFSELLLHSIITSAQTRAAECYFYSPEDDSGYYWIDRVIYGFRIESPNPLQMSNGNYTGSLKFYIGRHQDIDFGDGIYQGVLAHEISVKLTVRHQLRVDFPKGEMEGRSKVTLLPPGGWINFANNGKKVPNLLHQKLPFRLWASAPFTVTLRCQYLSGTECGLKNTKGHQATLNTYFINGNNEEFKITTIPFKFSPSPGNPILNGARNIKFMVVGDVVKEMMKYPGSTYKGDVTLIFDAAID
ncbi:hypothetical protein [Aeromonas sp. HMWF015]|uniref:hypothetical protein n=1 Tax=Aeromonas sp. HMWF015 TaxID=2056851 RepID=UPI002159DF2C|nr:hypothetical protein [Aeromonas sp. HMWF015]